jgi:hypothetical protein
MDPMVENSLRPMGIHLMANIPGWLMMERPPFEIWQLAAAHSSCAYDGGRSSWEHISKGMRANICDSCCMAAVSRSEFCETDSSRKLGGLHCICESLV